MSTTDSSLVTHAKDMPCSINGCCGKGITRGMCPKHYQRWRLNGDPNKVKKAITRPTGSGGFTSGGYLVVERDGARRYRHVMNAEAALGHPLPHGAHVHHVDGDPSNNSNTNLVICPSSGYHRLLHIRTNAINNCGNANWRKCTICHQHDAPSRMYQNEKTGACVHRECRNLAKASRKATRVTI